MNASIFLPTLSRPKLFQEFLKAYKETKAITPIWAVLDKSDPLKEEYLKIELPEGSRFILCDGVSMGDKSRELWPQLAELDAVFILNDDHVPKTPHWDQRVLSMITGTNVIGTNDGWVAPNRLCGAICFSGGVLRTLGYMFLPGQHHLFSDDLWMHLFSNAGCAQILMDVMVEHNHAYKNPQLVDETFVKINGPKGLVNGQGEGGFWPNDKKVFEAWLKTDAQKDVQKLIALQPKQGLMLATPAQDGNVAMDYALGLVDLSNFLTQQKVYFEMGRVCGSSLLPHARNSLVDMFLNSRCQKLLLCDSDQGWTKETVWPLFQSNKQIIAAVVPHKRFPLNLNFEPLPKDKHYFKDGANKSAEEFWNFAKERAAPNGEMEVNRAGTGMICIDRSVFEKLKDKVKTYKPFDFNDEAKHKEFFKFGIDETEHYSGEDWHFASLARENGIPIYINVNSLCTHRGNYDWNIPRLA